MKFSIKDFFSKFDQTRSLLRIWSYLLKKSLMENFIFLCSDIPTIAHVYTLFDNSNVYTLFNNYPFTEYASWMSLSYLFSSFFCKIFQNIFFIKYLWTIVYEKL